MRKLSHLACAIYADQLLDAIERVAQTRDAALKALNVAIDHLRAFDEWDNTDKREPLLRAMRRLKKGHPPEQLAIAGVGADAISAFCAASGEVGPAHERFIQAFDNAIIQISQAISEVSRNDRFREALIWQNRHAFQTGVEVLLKASQSQARGSKRQQHEEMVASYLQRYCVKNDTIGFFGPVGWARLHAHGAAISARPGPSLLASRTVSFEQWSIDELAAALAKNKWLRPWLAPRRLPYIYLDGTRLLVPSKQPVELSADYAAVLQACDGERTARAIAIALNRTHSFVVKTETEVYKILGELAASGLIRWTLEIPFVAQPEQSLRRVIERIGERRLREPALAVLGELESARDAIARAAGDTERLNRAIADLEALFIRLTSAAATRAAGAAYAARTLVYEDCRRDIEVDIGPAILQSLGPPLSLLLLSARWFTFEAAAIYRKAFHELYDELAQQSGSPTVDMANFWHLVQTRLLGDNTRHATTIMHRFQERWSQVLLLPEGQRHVTYTSAALRPRVLERFPAPGPGWQSARYHSPDVMIAATGIDAIRHDDYQLVLGELHIASNTLRGSFFIEQHPRPDDLFRAVECDLPEPRVIPITPRNWHEITSRTRPDFVTPKDVRLAFANDACGIPNDRTVPIGSLIVVDTDGGLVVRTRDGAEQFDIIEFFADMLSLEVVDGFKVLPPHPFTPRISIDRLVICRAAWRCAPAEMPFASEKTAHERFLAARQWIRAQGMPRRVFVKAPIERKPFYVDFDSPILVNIFAKTVRRMLERGEQASLITMTEMLPTLDQLWLPDAEEQYYTSELRIVAVDQVSG